MDSFAHSLQVSGHTNIAAYFDQFIQESWNMQRIYLLVLSELP